MSDKMSGIECECNEEHHYDVEESPLREFVKFLYEYFEVADKWIEMQRFAVERPIASVFLIVTLATFAVPVAIFMTFVLGSLIFSCIGFMFFEGTILAVGTLFLGGTLCLVGLFAAGLSMFLVATYYLLQMSGNVMMRIRGQLEGHQPVEEDTVKEE